MLKSIIRRIAGIFLFVAGGLAVIVVGLFMLRGTMHMWDRAAGAKSDGHADHVGDGGADDSDAVNDDGTQDTGPE